MTNALETGPVGRLPIPAKALAHYQDDKYLEFNSDFVTVRLIKRVRVKSPHSFEMFFRSNYHRENPFTHFILHFQLVLQSIGEFCIKYRVTL